ncbi:VanW family protein [Lacrimispora sp. 38-1]|uniref:VanW family protein n=1 Tax=Lacrimispora sp. 38-1 TaxID=3125778 RepID=UPI003CED7669
MDKNRARRIRERRNRKIVYGLLLLAALLTVGILYSFARSIKSRDSDSSQVVTDTKARETASEKALVSARIGQTNLSGLTVKEAKDTIEERYQWGMTVTDGTDSVVIDDSISGQLEEILKQLSEASPDQPQDYQLDYDSMKEDFKKQAEILAKRWNKDGVNSEVESFDRKTGAYSYTKEQSGRVLDQEKLVTQLLDAAKEENFQAEIPAEFSLKAPERTQAQAKEQYKVIGTFTTKTTTNKNRNQNISLAVGAINGLVLKPGEEFSFNNATGNRTSEKGYQPAGAYRNGVLIEEPGGGVCQVSTTLYHAIIESGFKTTERNSHSFAPSYVEKGQDAMVSFDGYAGPDLKFVNTGSTSVILRASLEGTTLKISVVGIPVLEDGVKVTIRSEKVKDSDPLPVTYEENTALPFGTEKVVDKGTVGGYYKSYRVLKKGDTVIKEEPLHNSSYKGKPEVIQRNTTLKPEETVQETHTEAESSLPPAEGQRETDEAENVGPGVTGANVQ